MVINTDVYIHLILYQIVFTFKILYTDCLLYAYAYHYGITCIIVHVSIKFAKTFLYSNNNNNNNLVVITSSYANIVNNLKQVIGQPAPVRFLNIIIVYNIKMTICLWHFTKTINI